MTEEITILEELKEYIPFNNQEELHALHRSLDTHKGAYDPIKVWKHDGKFILLDGHHRYDYCTKNNLCFTISEIQLENIDEAKLWMLTNQSAKRNIDVKYKAYLIGEQYFTEREKKKADKGLSKTNQWLNKEFATRFGIGERTVSHYREFYEAIVKLNAQKTLMSGLWNHSISETISMACESKSKTKPQQQEYTPDEYVRDLDGNKVYLDDNSPRHDDNDYQDDDIDPLQAPDIPNEQNNQKAKEAREISAVRTSITSSLSRIESILKDMSEEKRVIAKQHVKTAIMRFMEKL